jgi:hypothetical protein
MLMQLNEMLDAIISKEAYKEVKVECTLPYHPFELVRNIVEKIKTDKDFGKEYKEELSKQLQKQGYEHSEIIGIDSYSNCLVVSLALSHFKFTAENAEFAEKICKFWI